MQAPHLLTGQLAQVVLQQGRGVAPTGGVPQLVPTHQVGQPGELEDQLGLLLVLRVDDVGEVGEAGRAVGRVESPVRVLGNCKLLRFFSFFLGKIKAKISSSCESSAFLSFNDVMGNTEKCD